MATDRRDVLAGLGAALVLPLLPRGVAAATEERELFAAALRDTDGTYAAAVFSLEQGVEAKVPLPARGHSFAVRPDGRECIAFARRPGTFAIVFGPEGRGARQSFTARPGRHFYGHGVFSRDGRLLYTTENDFEAARGVIGVRDATNGYRQTGEFPSGGVGPHDLALMPDGRTLVVANGGMETHPAFGRRALNLESMAPGLAYVDTAHGEVLETHELPRELHQVSIRHLCVAAGGHVVFGCQHKGPRNLRPMLLGIHRRGDTLALMPIPRQENDRLRGYVGSIGVDGAGEIAAATSPRGGVALYLDVPGRRFLGHAGLADASGVTGRGAAPGFVLTSGSGRVASARPDGLEVRIAPAFAWDNHVVRL